MGNYLNSRKRYMLYRSEVLGDYFVDKSLLIQELFPLVERGN